VRDVQDGKAEAPLQVLDPEVHLLAQIGVQIVKRFIEV